MLTQALVSLALAASTVGGDLLSVAASSSQAAGPACASPEACLTEQFDAAVGPWVQGLLHDGLEGAILIPLARHPRAALRIVEHIRRSEDRAQRSIAAALVGFMGPSAPPSTLDELFEAESARDRAAGDGLERFNTQSVVEAIVFAGSRWCRHPERRRAGIALLRKVVERTLAGEYWNTCSSAMAGLVHHAPTETRDLLARFAAFSKGREPIHPSRPTLGQERTFAAALQAGVSDQIEADLARADAAVAAHRWSTAEQGRLAAFLAVASKCK